MCPFHYAWHILYTLRRYSQLRVMAERAEIHLCIYFSFSPLSFKKSSFRKLKAQQMKRTPEITNIHSALMVCSEFYAHKMSHHILVGKIHIFEETAFSERV